MHSRTIYTKPLGCIVKDIYVLTHTNNHTHKNLAKNALTHQHILTLSAMLICFSNLSCLPITLNVVLGPKRLHNWSAATVVQFLTMSSIPILVTYLGNFTLQWIWPKWISPLTFFMRDLRISSVCIRRHYPPSPDWFAPPACPISIPSIHLQVRSQKVPKNG